MTAIETRYIGPTNHKPARIVVEAGDRPRFIVSRHKWDDLDGEALFRKAAEAYCAKMGWDGRLVGGATKRGYTFVFVD